MHFRFKPRRNPGSQSQHRSVNRTAVSANRTAVSAVLLGVITLYWLAVTDRSVFVRAGASAVIGALIFAGVPESLRWVKLRALHAEATRTQEALGQYGPLVEVIRNHQEQLRNADQEIAILRRVLEQYDQLRSGVAALENFRGQEHVAERLAAAEHILNEMRIALGAIEATPPDSQGGRGLIIRTAPNTFRVIFSTPMRTPPQLKFSGLPEGVTPTVVEKSTITAVRLTERCWL